MKSLPEDHDLIAATQIDRKRGFSLLFARYWGVVSGFMKYLGAPEKDRDDLAQGTFLKAYLNFDRFIPGKPFSNWLLSIARNTYFDALRVAKKESWPAPILPDESRTLDVEEVVVNRETAEDYLAALSDDDRLLIELRLYLDLPFPQIGELLGETENALRVKFCRILKKFRAKN